MGREGLGEGLEMQGGSWMGKEGPGSTGRGPGKQQPKSVDVFATVVDSARDVPNWASSIATDSTPNSEGSYGKQCM
jgi:hypothetical protein